MVDNDLESNVARMVSISWRWDKTSIERILISLGWQHHDKVGHRDAYIVHKDVCGSVYSDDNNVTLIEVEFDVFSNVDALDALEYEDKIDEFFEKFNVVTTQLAELLGNPKFSDGAAAIGFPDDQDATWLSLWSLPTARFMVQLKHEDRDIPFRLCIVVAPPAT